MGKYAIVIFSFLISFFLLLMLPTQSENPQECPFCSQTVLQRQKFYEDERVMALYTHKPIQPGHVLIIPKRHVERFEELTDAEVSHIGQVVKKVDTAVQRVFGTSSYLLLQKNGKEVGQTVSHLHVHYIPRKSGEDSTLGFLLNMFWANIKSPIPPHEIEKIVAELKAASATNP